METKQDLRQTDQIAARQKLNLHRKTVIAFAFTLAAGSAIAGFSGAQSTSGGYTQGAPGASMTGGIGYQDGRPMGAGGGAVSSAASGPSGTPGGGTGGVYGMGMGKGGGAGPWGSRGAMGGKRGGSKGGR